MSTAHGPVRARYARTAPPRRRLFVVPQAIGRTPRAPFAALVVAIIGAGLVGLLVVNTTLQQGAFELTRLQRQDADLKTREVALQLDVDRLSSPGHVAAAAGDLGMVPNTNPVFLRLPGGKIIGHPEPAEAGTNLPGIRPPGPTSAQIAAAEAAKQEAAAKKAAEAKLAKAKAKADATAKAKSKPRTKPTSKKPGTPSEGGGER